jgi:LmbE family N-acetylglucosaminyl deacetylase
MANPIEPTAALAIFAHPDDFEFTCAGTLALLARYGWKTHYLNLADGCCGSLNKSPEAAAAERWDEAQQAAGVLGAMPHPPLFHDLECFFQ